MLDFNLLLREAEIDPALVVNMRHQPMEPSLRRVLPWMVTDRPDLFVAYQQVQLKTGERMLARAKFLASFIGQEPGRATFAGIYFVGSARRLDHETYLSFPGNAELIRLGMLGAREGREPLAFDLERQSTFVDWIGRLIIDWPKPERVWSRWAGRGVFTVRAILEESRFARSIPHWNEVVLSWAELAVLPSTWQAALAQWRGIYFIFDSSLGKGYVESAGGAENVLGRWRGYAETGHGGNKRLRESRPQDLVFSILELTAPDLDKASLVATENRWKDRLHTRTHGLNLN